MNKNADFIYIPKNHFETCKFANNSTINGGFFPLLMVANGAPTRKDGFAIGRGCIGGTLNQIANKLKVKPKQLKFVLERLAKYDEVEITEYRKNNMRFYIIRMLNFEKWVTAPDEVSGGEQQ